MGIDVLLYAEVTPTAQELEAARVLFRRSGIADDYQPERGTGWKCLEFEDETEWHGPRVVANVTTRYYGPGYERGDWPSIYGAIVLLQAAFPSARICYGGDSDDIAPEFDQQAEVETWQHFSGPHGDDYRARNRARNAAASESRSSPD